MALDCEALALIYTWCKFWKGTDAAPACPDTETDPPDARF